MRITKKGMSWKKKKSRQRIEKQKGLRKEGL